MGIDKVEELEDRVKIAYTLYQYYAQFDRQEFKEILYKDVPSLPEDKGEYLEKKGLYDSFEEKNIFLSKINRTIGFVIEEYEEQNGSYTERSIYGPFLVK